MKFPTNFLLSLGLIGSVGYALPIQHNHAKREVVTRMHTAEAKTVTDFYSTTTNILVAPTVQFIVSGSVTYTTTLSNGGVDPTAQPTVTLTTTLPVKQVAIASSIYINGDGSPSQSAASTISSNVATPEQTTSVQATVTLAPSSSIVTDQNEDTVTSAASSSTMQPTTSSVAGNLISAIGVGEVQASVVTPPPAQVHTSTTTSPSTTSTTSTSLGATTESSAADQETAYFSTSSSGIETPTTASTATSSSTSSTSSGDSSTIPLALTYSPYNSDGTCRSSDSVYSDLQIIKSKGVSQVRIYGTDCNSLQTVQPACAKLGIKINQGLWIDSTGVDSIDSGLALLIEYGQQNGWDIFEYITIGNEAVNSGFCTVSDLISKIKSAKSQLKSAGYSGQVTTSEPPVTFVNNADLCTESTIDFVGINPHSYFNADVDAAGAGAFIKAEIDLTKSVCGTDNVVVTETGYPSSGNTNGKNVPSTENQQIAVKSILEELNQQATILSYFDDLWKAPGPYGIEQSFGIESFMA